MLQRCLCHSSIFCSGTKKNFHRYEVQRRFWWVATLCVVALKSGDFVRRRKKMTIKQALLSRSSWQLEPEAGGSGIGSGGVIRKLLVVPWRHFLLW